MLRTVCIAATLACGEGLDVVVAMPSLFYAGSWKSPWGTATAMAFA
jgi:hypothetical protein